MERRDILASVFKSKITMTRKDITSNNAGLGLICPACGKNGCNIIADGDTIMVPSVLHKSNPCDLAVGLIPCDECKGDFWLIDAGFASKELLSREKNSPITEGYLNSKSELPIETRMMFNCPQGDDVMYQCDADQWKWTCVEYRINGKEPFQWHLIGPFHFFNQSTAISPYGMMNCGNNSVSEFQVGAKFLINNWSKFIKLAEERHAI